ncbi:glutamate--cysteine ligase [Allokutzneria sp. A3M-2-11 16]|uniref:carboxylate-amine ligase n=1 Tax=Allokutzneria sp. A3M-2-11 16 TaxID=2962043 RepID=UPI0020B797B6|nr:glutamate--cysteine ligase [Allokutzneria sp. A3M-2-11 16]MCP3804381.1 glutamate--cysteine ligase [Allokutzneria sp. A3M-2-11 16]
MTTDNAGVTVGVEEEFLLVDPGTGFPAPGGADVLRHARARRRVVSLQGEMLSTQVEAATGVCADLGELHDHLSEGRALLADGAGANGMLLVPTGTPVLRDGPPPPAEGDRFAAIIDAYAEVAEHYQVNGCHVHVGVPDRDTAIAVINHLRPWLPTLLALSANSIFTDGRDSGYASWRVLEQSRFPGWGVTPWFGSAHEYDDEVARLVACGAVMDEAMSFWLARPSPRFPTVELRVADTVPTADEAVLQAALTRGLVRTALTDLERGREAHRISDQVAATAIWTAARHGVHGEAVHPVHLRRVPATAMMAELLDHIRPALNETGDLERTEQLLKTVIRDGSGADRQRIAAARGPRAVIAMLADDVRS